MNKNKIIINSLIVTFILFTARCSTENPADILKLNTAEMPHLQKQGNATQFIVDGKPFLILGGELHNSSTSGFAYMRPFWKKMAEANLNTVIGGVSWELVEPVEGHFEFALVDSMILGARKENLKLVIIWFASWKNSESTYVPAWVKKNQNRFPLVKSEQGRTLNILSTFSEESCNADSRAFGALMKHIREMDSKNHTVIMMQVENEIGTVGSRRDFSETADAAFNSQVPPELMGYLEKNKTFLHPGVLEAWGKQGFRKEGKWEEVFETGVLKKDWKDMSYLTEELFMAWNYARYVEKVAAAGRSEYNLPMYVNAWLKQPDPYGHAPGNYPSGGPTPQVLAIWRAAAPSIDFIAPDIYIVNEYRYVCEQYTLSGNPLCIPETTGDAASASRVFWTFGKFNTLCYSPFGIDGGDSWANVSDISFIKDSYSTLNQLSQLISKYSGTENVAGLLVDDNNRADSVIIGGYSIKGTLGKRSGGAKLAGVDIFGAPGSAQAEGQQAGGALIICTGPGEYYIAGRNMIISFSSENPETLQNISFLYLEDGTLKNNEWIPDRRMNGDEFRIAFPQEKSMIFKTALYTY